MMQHSTPQPAPEPAGPPPTRRARRRLLALGAGYTLAAAVAAACAGNQPATTAARPATVATTPAAATIDSGQPLRQPLMITSDPYTRLLDVRLSVDTATLQVPQPGGVKSWNMRAYQVLGGNTVSQQAPTFPGPTFRVRRGDRVRINLINNLTQTYPNTACQPYPASTEQPAADTFQDCYHGPSYTNIHYHGFHVTPDSLGDDVLLVVAPLDSFQYDFRIPSNQSPGTHWYHPHKHGSVALQVANGMSGAFIVEGGPLDSLTESLQMVERVIAFQQVDTSLNLLRGAATGPATTLVNGQYFPSVSMRPNEVQRWRFANENYTSTANFNVSFAPSPGGAPKMYDVARDGVQFAPVNYDPDSADTFLSLAPGERLDVFVQAPGTPGTHRFLVRIPPVALRSRKLRGAPLSVAQGVRGRAQAPAEAVVFTVNVAADTSTYNTVIPAAHPEQPPYLQGDLPGAPDTAMIVFTDSAVWNAAGPGTAQTPTAPTHFWLGSAPNPYQQFNDTVVFVPSDSAGTALPMVLGATQTWQIVNHSQQKINHPFHIHINPFQVDSVYYPNGSADAFAALYAQLNQAARNGAPIWLDVLPLPQPVVDAATGSVTTPGYVYITQRYDSFAGCTNCGSPTGQYVMHCHILGHEERGMMQVLQLNPSATAAVRAVSAVAAEVARPRSETGHGHH
jgi:FtsP/CotA-like multicopper oxidase with cupredoxin domain